MLLNDRDPVRWYESVKNTILQVVGWINGPATRYNQGARLQKMTIPVTRFNPIMQLLLKLSGQGAISVVPAVSCWSLHWRTHLPIPKLILQATCYAPTPLGSEFPRGLFGAVESGQEEAVRFFQAWKAQVALGKPWTVEVISNLTRLQFRWSKRCQQIDCLSGRWKKVGNPSVRCSVIELCSNPPERANYVTWPNACGSSKLFIFNKLKLFEVKGNTFR